MKKKIPSVKNLYKKISKNNLQKNSVETDELWYSRLIGRKISIYFTWIFLKLGMTPNQATLVSFLLGILGLLFLSFNSTFFFTLGFILFHLYIIVDSSDGEMARFLNMKSDMGAFYDKLLHYLMKIGIIIVLSIQVYYRFNNPIYIIFGLSTALLSGFSSTFYHLLPKNNTVSYSDQVKSDGLLLGYIRKIFRTITGDIELSIILILLVLFELLINQRLGYVYLFLLISQFILLVLYVLQQIFINSIKTSK